MVEELGEDVDTLVEELRFFLPGWPMESDRDRDRTVPQIPVSAVTRPGGLGQPAGITGLQPAHTRGGQPQA